MSEPNRVAMAESYRLGFEAGKAEQDATISKLRKFVAWYEDYAGDQLPNELYQRGLAILKVKS